MKEIEHSSPPWNDAPSRRDAFLESTLAVLRSSLGKRWPVSLLGFGLVMFFPTLIFRFLWKEITLEPALFVTEWLHLTIEGVFFFFILEIIRHRSLSATANQAMIDFVSHYSDAAVDCCSKTLARAARWRTINRNTRLGQGGLDDLAARPL
jgi:hypothetical protein